jgi:hypothetical protein
MGEGKLEEAKEVGVVPLESPDWGYGEKSELC